MKQGNWRVSFYYYKNWVALSDINQFNSLKNSFFKTTLSVALE